MTVMVSKVLRPRKYFSVKKNFLYRGWRPRLIMSKSIKIMEKKTPLYLRGHSVINFRGSCQQNIILSE